jgi:ATP-dependent DNA helicase RecG
VIDAELTDLVAGLRRVGRDDVGLEVKLASGTDLPKRTVNTICAFSNTPGGGALLLGLDESSGFTTVGCENAGKLAADLAGLCRKNLQPAIIPHISQPEFEGKTLLVAEAPELDIADKPCYLTTVGQSNGSYIRVADGNRQLTPYEVSQFLANRGQPLFDCEPVRDATGDDLNGDLVQEFLANVRRSRTALAQRDDDDLLRRFRVLVRATESDEYVPSISGLLALGRDPQAFGELRSCAVTVTVYPTTVKGQPGPNGERFLDDRIIEGPVPVMVEEVLTGVLTRISRQGIVKGIGRDDQWEYPLTAIREIVVNAVAHRDYGPMARGTRVQVELYPDRLEVISPGGLFGPVTIEKLGDEGTASTRNRVLMDLLENLRFQRDRRFICEGRATGIPTVRNSLREAGRAPAVFADRIRDFRVSLPNRSLLDEETLRWLASLNVADLSATQNLALAILRTGRLISTDEYRHEFGVDSGVARAELAGLARRQLVRAIGGRRWTRYALNTENIEEAPDLFSMLGDETDAVPATAGVMDPMEARKNLVLTSLQQGPLSRADIARSLQMPDRQVRYVLRQLKDAGLIVTTEANRSPNVRYRLRGR